MLDSLFIIVPVSILLGFLSGIGVGGGSLLILWLTLVLQMDPVSARNLNLLFFIPSALISTFFRWKQGSVCLKKVLPAILAGSISACIFSNISNLVDTDILKKLFGLILLATGIKELFYRPRKPK